MPRKKEGPKAKLVLSVPEWVPKTLDKHAAAIRSSRNKAGSELIIHGMGANQRMDERFRAGDATVKRKMWEIWCRQRALYWALYRDTRNVGNKLDEVIAGIPEQYQGEIKAILGTYIDQMQETYLPNISKRVRYLLKLLANWTGTSSAPEFIYNCRGRKRPCRSVAAREYPKLGQNKMLPANDIDIEDEYQEEPDSTVQL